jgi:hypothetical protein
MTQTLSAAGAFRQESGVEGDEGQHEPQPDDEVLPGRTLAEVEALTDNGAWP